jgi:hypothetical protein
MAAIPYYTGVLPLQELSGEEWQGLRVAGFEGEVSGIGEAGSRAVE